MRSVLIAAGFGLIISILLTPLAIRAFRRQGLGQEIRDDGPESHLSKKGTPTMGGTVIVGATVGGYLAAHLFLSDAARLGLHRHRAAAAVPDGRAWARSASSTTT